MTTIIKTNDLEIKKNKNLFFLSLKDKNKYDQKFLNSLKNLRLKKIEPAKYSFQAEIVISFKKFLTSNNNKLSYSYLVSLFLSLKKQIELLKNENIGILYFDLNDILVVKNDTYYDFFYVNKSMFFDIKDNIIQIDKIFNKSEKTNQKFLSPELIIINKIPSSSYFTCSYFSLAILVAFCINGNNLDYFKTHDWCEDDLEKIMEPIHSTKLFYALQRASILVPEKRYLLWI
tara:strand:- start:156 stop:848 length:693 start_codon:yes stop_codon:yes gene_type:complete